MDFTPRHLLEILAAWSPHGRCWVAYSGGLDSEVLLNALAAVRTHLGTELRAVHIDHGLQPAARDWSAHCEASCRRLAIALSVRRVQVSRAPGTSLEAEARRARYRALADIMQTDDLLLTAQHRDDQAETLLLQLLRGAGPAGLASMPPLAPFPPGRIGRPLLSFAREQLRTYALERGLTWVEDPSNAELGPDRNYLRHRVLPLFARRWPGYRETLARSARLCGEAQGLIDDLAERQLHLLRGTGGNTLSVSRLLHLERPLCRVALRHWIHAAGFRLPDERHLERVVSELLPAARDRTPLVAWDGCEVRRYRDDLHLLAPLPPSPGTLVLPWRNGPGLQLPPPLGRLRLAGQDRAGVIPGPRAGLELEVRFRHGGERCRPAGGRHHKPLKKLFQERGIPGWLRPYLPLLYANGEVAAVGGLLLCAPAADIFCQAGVQVLWEDHPWTALL